ncbi:MAG: hypothetical protein SPF98_04210 [Campylobacter sp.]|nr:hypothetical protein [Campylobacter sp.]
MAISIKTPKDIEGIRVANHIVALTLDGVEKLIKPGVSLLELDEFCEKSIKVYHGI